MLMNIPAKVFVKRTSDLRFNMFNRAGELLLGYSRNDLLGKSDHDFFPKEQADAFTAEDRKVAASNQNQAKAKAKAAGRNALRFFDSQASAVAARDTRPD